MTHFWLIVTYNDGHVARFPFIGTIGQARNATCTYETIASVKSVKLQFK